jgi:predicted DNA repair protein MutK
MAAGSLLALIDDIATILDDVALLTKVAAKKTAGVLGDDLALNAQQVAGLSAERELPVVWAVAKGSFVNKLILVPSALLISAVAPVLIIPLLMIGGAYLCYEGFEKIAHGLLHSKEEDAAHRVEHVRALADPSVDLVALERGKIKGAIRTDFILSAEIVVISLGTVAEADFVTRVGVLCGIAILMTVGVYGLVAGIVKLDDAGLYLSRKSGSFARALGAAILRVAPWLMKGLSVAGTAAMFLVGGGILVHGIPALHHWTEEAGWLVTGAVGAATGIAAGALALAAVKLVQAMIRRWDRSRA